MHLADVQQLVGDDGDSIHEQILTVGRQEDARSLINNGVIASALDWGQAGQTEMHPIKLQAFGDGAESLVLQFGRDDQEGAGPDHVACVANLQGQQALDVADDFEGADDASAVLPARVSDEGAGRDQLGLGLAVLVIEQCHESRPLIGKNR